LNHPSLVDRIGRSKRVGEKNVRQTIGRKLDSHDLVLIGTIPEQVATGPVENQLVLNILLEDVTGRFIGLGGDVTGKELYV